jgi:hypothetical protein
MTGQRRHVGMGLFGQCWRSASTCASAHFWPPSVRKPFSLNLQRRLDTVQKLRATVGSFGSAFLAVSFHCWVFCAVSRSMPRALADVAVLEILHRGAARLDRRSDAAADVGHRRALLGTERGRFAAEPRCLAASLEVSRASMSSALACWLKNMPMRRAVPARASTPTSVGRS